MLARARRDLGLGEPNYIQANYRRRNGAAYAGNFAWCDAAVTEWARDSANTKAVLPAGDRAYTVWHAGDFQKLGHWHAGTRANVAKAKPGDVVFFDWGGTDVVGRIDHVGVVELVLPDGRLQTIEGNTADACRRRIRSYTVIAGYGRPTYTAPTTAPPAQEDDMDPNTIVKVPDYWADKKRSKFSHPTYSAAFLWAGTLNEVRAYGSRIEAKLGAQQVTIAELTKTVAVLAANSASVDPDALVARIQDAINKVTVHLDVTEE